MDLDGVDYSVLYPTIGGVAGERFGRLNDIELETACVQAYNDWLIEEWAGASPRFVPQCIVPIWPMERTVAEIRRAVGMGHKGVIYPASPMELKSVPHINEPAYDPLWSVCQELSVPLCFHSGASPKIQMRPDDNFSPAAARAFSGIVRSVSSIAVLANFLFSRVLYRFPNLKVVFAESSIGWAAYEMEYADYQSAADGLPQEGYPLKPSELFQRQCYFTCWYDRESLRVRRYPGNANILWSTNFPLETSTWPAYTSPYRERYSPACPSKSNGKSSGRTRPNSIRLSHSHQCRGGKMNRPKVRHVAVMTKNREKMVEFYQKIFGLEPKRGFGGAIYMSDGDVNIALIEVKREDQKEGINHFGFEVDDLDEIKRRLKEAGFSSEIDSKSDKDSDHRIQDPDGHWVDMAVKLRWPK